MGWNPVTNLTVKQEKFCQHYAAHGNASEAYRHAYNTENTTPEVVWVKACELKKNGNVAVRLLELQEEAKERANVTIDTIREMLLEDRKLAQDTERAAAAVSATMGLAKLFGLLTDKTELSGGVEGVVRVDWSVVDPKEGSDGNS